MKIIEIPEITIKDALRKIEMIPPVEYGLTFEEKVDKAIKWMQSLLDSPNTQPHNKLIAYQYLNWLKLFKYSLN